MTLLDDILDVTVTPTMAEAQARRNFAANWRALMGSQPRLLDGIGDDAAPDLTWIFGRDGTLTAMLPGAGERWWAGCSIPRRAAQAMLGKLDATGVTACLLAPTHAAQVRACLNRMSPRQALFVVVPEIEALRVMLHCEDLSPFVQAHRLWLAAGEGWIEHLDEVLTVYPGLPTPSQFIRLPDVAEEDLERYTRPAKQLFAQHTSTRLELLRAAQQQPPTKRSTTETTPRRICVIAPRGFQLWENAGVTAAAALTDLAGSAALSVLAFNSDDPLLASPVALAQASVACDAIVAANLYRSDLPGVVPDHVTWITWLTSPRVVPFDSAHTRDAVLVADSAWRPLVIAAKWPEARIAPAPWPELIVQPSPDVEPALAIVADTCNVDIDLTTLELSSHRLLWSQIRHDVAADPFRVLPDPDAYLSQVLRQHRVPDEGLDRARFIHQLIVPAYQQALARALIEHHLPLRLFGHGWDRIEEFAGLANGPVASEEAFGDLLGSAAALVHCWPTSTPHPIAAVRKPLVPRCSSRKELIATAWDRFSKPQMTRRTQGNPFETVIALVR